MKFIKESNYISITCAVLFLATMETIQLSNKKEPVYDPNCGKASLFVEPRKSSYLESQISNGSASDVGQFPQFVSLQIIHGNRKKSHCSGVILKDSIILTAGHCVDEKTAKSKVTKVRVVTGNRPMHGQFDKIDTSLYQIAEAKKWCIHRGYTHKPMTGYDLAIVILKDQIRLNNYAQSACLPSRKLQMKDRCYLLGGGIINDSRHRADRMRVLPSKLMTCSEYTEEKDGGSSRICVKASNPKYPGDSCPGDSGGPLMCHFGGKWEVHGLVSTSADGCKDNPATSIYLFNIRAKQHDLHELIHDCLHK